MPTNDLWPTAAHITCSRLFFLWVKDYHWSRTWNPGPTTPLQVAGALAFLRQRWIAWKRRRRRCQNRGQHIEGLLGVRSVDFQDDLVPWLDTQRDNVEDAPPIHAPLAI